MRRSLWGSGGIATHILNLGTRRRREVSVTHRPFYPRGQSPQNQLYRRMVRPQSDLEFTVKRKIS
jgi:hypothetical protein